MCIRDRVTDIKEAIEGDNVEVIYSTFDELPEHHKRVSEMVIERAKRLEMCIRDRRYNCYIPQKYCQSDNTRYERYEHL